MSWLSEARKRIDRGEPCVLVTLAEVSGSAPRDPGAKLLVTDGDLRESIGGGNLEYRAIAKAQDLMGDTGDCGPVVEQVLLGPALGQCCGGKVVLVFERLGRDAAAWLERWQSLVKDCRRGAVLTPLDPGAGKIVLLQGDELDRLCARVRSCPGETVGCGFVTHPDFGRCLFEWVTDDRTPLHLFGAGHVGGALARALEPLPFRVTWIDSRPGYLPSAARDGLTLVPSSTPEREVAAAPSGAMVLVMTHSHAEDLRICAQALRRDDLAFVGLIGSQTKRARFLQRLRTRGLSEPQVQRLVCPIGLDAIAGKDPAVIAASAAAQLLAESEAQRCFAWHRGAALPAAE